MGNLAPGAAFNGLTREQFDYVGRESKCEMCSVCGGKVFAGTYREQRKSGVVCYGCLQKEAKVKTRRKPL